MIDVAFPSSIGYREKPGRSFGLVAGIAPKNWEQETGKRLKVKVCIATFKNSER